jgi:hypothetical protein
MGLQSVFFVFAAMLALGVNSVAEMQIFSAMNGKFNDVIEVNGRRLPESLKCKPKDFSWTVLHRLSWLLLKFYRIVI